MVYGTVTENFGKYGRLNIVLIAAGALVSSYAISSVNVSLAQIAADLHTSVSLVSASFLVYLLVISGLFLFFGKLGDVWGYRAVFLSGTFIFLVGSLLCGLAGTVIQLIILRAVQAVGASMIAAIGPAYIVHHVPEHWHGRGLAYVTGAAALGVILGPTLGLSITNIWGWNWTFFCNIPVCIAILAAGWFTLPKKNDALPGKQFDLMGASLFSCAIVSLVIATSSVYAYGITDLVTGSLTLFSFAFWTLAIVYECATEDPAFEIRLFKDRHFTYANISLFLVKMSFNGPVFLFPSYLHLVLGYSYEIASLVVIVPGAIMLISCPWVGTLTDTYSSRALCLIGSAGACAAYLFFAESTTGLSLAVVIVVLVFLGFARGIFLIPNTKLILDHTPEQMKGASAGVMKALGNTGIVLGVVIFQIAFSETLLAGEAAALDQDPFSIPMPALAEGFQVAFLLAAALSLAALFFAWYARDATGTGRGR